MAKYGLAIFTFSVIELVTKDLLLSREQHWLDWLFSLSPNFRYNFAPTAGSCLGTTRSSETRKKISAAMSGSNNLNYGKLARNALGVSIFTKDGLLVKSFDSQVEAAKYLGVTQPAVARAVRIHQ